MDLHIQALQGNQKSLTLGSLREGEGSIQTWKGKEWNDSYLHIDPF